MKQYAVIVAGGSGTRMGGNIPKQFRSLNGRPVLWWSIKAFHEENHDTKIIVVLPENFISLWYDFYSSLPSEQQYPHEVTSGGTSRSESVRNGLKIIKDDESLVAVHDGARPLVALSLLKRGWEEAKQTGAAIPVVPVTDSIRKLEDGKSHNIDRANLRAVQTPQVFRTSLLKEAYNKAGDRIFTDDATVVENLGVEVSLFEGSPENIKITNPKDLAIATVLMGKDV
ncbi:MAG: 2-C-methyl-D-erythritol 4-phosphate cytidylyltransferase [Muribaculaceae bacterium]|nr:2-C-methyl-D-erythritol 4-phosphate cytidylyltransferase [Muribaculaceae bacterium]